jgi:hypothetical protein
MPKPKRTAINTTAALQNPTIATAHAAGNVKPGCDETVLEVELWNVGTNGTAAIPTKAINQITKRAPDPCL